MDIYSKDDCKKYIEKLNTEYRVNHLRSQERDELISENNIEKKRCSWVSWKRNP